MWAIVHENAHQWFGDSVTMRRWRDIWLAEGFATYSEWVWSQARHAGSAEQLFLATFHEHPTRNSLWKEPLDGPGYPLDNTPYYRGAMMLQALRNRVGSAAFYRILRTWARHREHRNGTTAQFESLARSVSGQPLTTFFRAWGHRDLPPEANVGERLPGGCSGGVGSQACRRAAVVGSDRPFRRDAGCAGVPAMTPGPAVSRAGTPSTKRPGPGRDPSR